MNDEDKNTKPVKQQVHHHHTEKGDKSFVSGTIINITSSKSSGAVDAAKMLDQTIDNRRKASYGTSEKDEARTAAKMSGVRRQPATIAKYLSGTPTTNNNNNSNSNRNSNSNGHGHDYHDEKIVSQMVPSTSASTTQMPPGTLTCFSTSTTVATATATAMLKKPPPESSKTSLSQPHGATTMRTLTASAGKDDAPVPSSTPRLSNKGKGRSTLQDMEDEKAMKVRAKPGPTTVVKKRSSTTNTSIQTSAVSKQLQRMEEEAEAKAKARNDPNGAVRLSRALVSTSLTKQPSQVEAKVAAFNQQRKSTKSAAAVAGLPSTTPTTTPGASFVTTPQDDKAVAVSGTNSTSRRPGVGRSMLEDERITRKMDGEEVTAAPSKQRRDDKRIDEGPPLKNQGPRAPHEPTPFESPPYFTNSCDDDCDEENCSNDLVVAKAVVDDENDDEYIPKALEYDPDAKPPVIKNRRFRLYMAVSCIAMIVIVASTIGVMSLTTSNGSDSLVGSTPTSAPTCERCGLGIEEALELAVGSDKLYGESSPYNKAMEWILYDDALQLGPTDTNLLQRFVLATFYFQTHEKGDWLACNRPVEENGEDDTCDHQLLAATRPELQYTSIPSYRWLGATDECTWAGVACDEFGQMRHIDLQAYELKGTFPQVLSLLPYMQSFSFPRNYFEGPLPDEIGNMKHLLNVELQFNSFTGSFPKGWGRSRNLQLINVGENLLSGSLPEEIGDISTLKGLFVMDNNFTGWLPESISKLRLLTYARFQDNMFSGTIPSSFGSMQLNELWLRSNAFTGQIPSELGLLSNSLADLRMDKLSLSGPIPEELWSLTNLWRLEICDTSLSGTISSSIGNIENVIQLDFHDANFSGQLPTELGLLTRLESLKTQGNLFVGSIPTELCTLRSPDGGLQEVWTSEDVTCVGSCCTHFCQAKTDGGGETLCYDPSQMPNFFSP